jgi:hypothetical protein
MGDPTRSARLPAGGAPRLPKRPDRGPACPRKDPRRDDTAPLKRTAGLATLVASPGVGTLTWSRQCNLLTVGDVFSDPGPGTAAFPTHDYRITSVLPSGREVITAELTKGPAGGFMEPRPYSVANVYLCLRRSSESRERRCLERATATLNNIIEIHQYLTLDPLARSVNGDRDSYYTLVSSASIPDAWPDTGAREVLQRLSQVHFGSTLGVDRTHHVGANSYDDLLSGYPLPPEFLRLFAELAAQPHSLEVFHVLVFSAIRRLKRFECSLAVLDAESAFEALVSAVLRDSLVASGTAAPDIEQLFAQRGRFDSLQKRLVEIDRVARAEASIANQPVSRFLGSPEEVLWRRDLYRLRHRVVHEGLREVSFDDAKKAVVAGLKAAHAVQRLRPGFQRALMWSGAALDLGTYSSLRVDSRGSSKYELASQHVIGPDLHNDLDGRNARGQVRRAARESASTGPAHRRTSGCQARTKQTADDTVHAIRLPGLLEPLQTPLTLPIDASGRAKAGPQTSAKRRRPKAS